MMAVIPTGQIGSILSRGQNGFCALDLDTSSASGSGRYLWGTLELSCDTVFSRDTEAAARGGVIGCDVGSLPGLCCSKKLGSAIDAGGDAGVGVDGILCGVARSINGQYHQCGGSSLCMRLDAVA